MADHDYFRETLFDANVINTDPQKDLKINRIIETKYNNLEPSAAANLDFKSRIENLVKNIVLQNDLELIITKLVMHQGPKNVPLHNEIICQINRKVEIVKLDLNILEAPKPSGDNYVNVTQNSPEWFTVRKYKVTGSRLPSLIGLSGKSKFDLMWEVVKESKSDTDMTFIKNISRGHYCEGAPITNFEKGSNCKTEKCGFFLHPTDTRYGSSPDALEPLGILLEVKTRAEGFSGPLESLEKFPHYFVQCQLQMLCTGVEFCILQSYHPESKTSKFFIIKYNNNTLMTIIKEIVDCIFDENHMLDWDYTEIVELQTFAKQILGKVPNFEL